MTAIEANGITIEVERHGGTSATPLLLIRGLGSQLIHWPPALINGFVANGFHVVAYDNRDSGLSRKFGEWGVPDIADVRRRAAAGLPLELPYTLDDMAADGIGVLDALNIPTAHILGISMGGMIVQLMAHHYPDRVSSATIVMSSSGKPSLPARSAEIEQLLLSQPADPHDRDQVIEHTLRCDRAWSSPGFPFDVAERRALIARAYDRSHCPGGVARQYAAAIGSGSRVDLLKALRVPALVVHGTDDPLLPIEHGRDIADNILGAEFIVVAGMGHDLEGAICDTIVVGATRLAGSTSARGQGANPVRGTPSG